MTYRPISTRNGVPAYMNAPPRLRQSAIEIPRQPMSYPKPSLLKRLWARWGEG